MSVETREFVVTVPHGTLASAPQRTSLAMPSRLVRAIRLRFPPGPSGTVGCQLTSNGSQVIPVNAGAYFIGDDEIFDLNIERSLTSGAWQLTAYNTGTYDHSLYLTFYLDPTQLPAGVQASALIDPALLSGETALPN